MSARRASVAFASPFLRGWVPISLRRIPVAFVSPPHRGWAPVSTLRASTVFASPPHGGWVPKSYSITLRGTTNQGGNTEVSIIIPS